jgi:hypothetical protein
MYRKHSGTDHFSVSSDWCQQKAKDSRKLMHSFGSTFGFEAKVSPWNGWLDIPADDSVPYYSSMCTKGVEGSSFEEWRLRRTSLVFLANCPDDRLPMLVRAIALRMLGAIKDSNVQAFTPDTRIPVEDFGKQIQQARFGLFTRGDTPSSVRLYDLLALGVIPIVVADGIEKVALPFPCDVDWANMAYFVKVPVAKPLVDALADCMT